MDHPPQLAKKYLRSALLVSDLGFFGAAAHRLAHCRRDIIDENAVEKDRSEVTGSAPVTNLAWVITDKDGYTVLERSADNESMYRNFNNGRYSAHINAWYEDRYHQISEEFHIDC